jgi:hypothetical protein
MDADMNLLGDVLGRSVPGLLLSLVACTPALAVDVVPFAGFRFGGDLTDPDNATAPESLTIDGSSSFGGVIDIPFGSSSRALELYYSRQSSTLDAGTPLSPAVADVTLSVFHIGIVDTVPADTDGWSWLLIGTAGATSIETDVGNDTQPSIGLGGGAQWMPNEHFGLRADLRGIITFTGGGSTVIACGGGCIATYRGTVMLQGEASIGVVFRF